MPWHPDPKMQVNREVNQVRSHRNRWSASVGSTNSTHARGKSPRSSPVADPASTEGPGEGDDTRNWGPPYVGPLSAYFIGVNRNKRSLTLDLSGEEGRRVLERLIRAADIVVMTAAVADYRPAETRDAKIKKAEAGDTLTLQLVANPDILAGLSSRKRDDQVVVGFAAETEPDPQALIDLGRRKLAAKGSDFLVLNQVGWSQGFATESNEVVVLRKGGDIVMEASGSKLSVADRILDVIA